jgi:hypothetical protein
MPNKLAQIVSKDVAFWCSCGVSTADARGEGPTGAVAIGCDQVEQLASSASSAAISRSATCCMERHPTRSDYGAFSLSLKSDQSLYNGFVA